MSGGGTKQHGSYVDLRHVRGRDCRGRLGSLAMTDREGLGVSSMTTSRRGFLGCLGLAAASVVVSGRARGQKPSGASRKPNIILIMADDLGYGDIGCYGNASIRTPHLDALAAGGMRFTDFHANAPVCSPTRAALLTGRYQQRCGVEGVVTAKGHRETGMSLEALTFAEVLKEAGYRTALFGKWHLGYEASFNPVHQGFDEFRGYVSGNVDYHSHIDGEGYEDWWDGSKLRPEKGYVTDLITEHGVRFIEQNADKPFCLYLPHEAPHFPYQGRNDPPERSPGGGKPTHGRRTDQEGAYKEMIEAMDEGIGRIVDAVRRQGLERDTFLFFCSDNGASLGSNAPFQGTKSTLWEGGHRVPAIACWPGVVPAGGTTDACSMSADLFPTMAALAGASPPAGHTLDGVDLGPVLRGEGALAERDLFWAFNDASAVRRGDWKLLVNQGERKKQPGDGRARLYNLRDDPGESKDLSGEKPELVQALRKALGYWERKVREGAERVS